MPNIGVRPNPHTAVRTSVSSAMTVSTTAYDANDLVGAALTFTNVAGFPKSAGIIRRIQMTDPADQKLAADFVLMTSAPSTSADHAAFNLPDANLTDIIAIVSVVSSDYVDCGDNAIVSVDVDLPFLSDSDNSIYGYVVTRGTPTYADETMYVTLWTDPQK